MLKACLLSLLIRYSKATFEQVTVTQSSARDKSATLLYCNTLVEKKFRQLDNLPFVFNTFGVVLLLLVVFVFSGMSRKHKAC